MGKMHSDRPHGSSHWSPRRALLVIVGLMVALWIGIAGMLDLLPLPGFFS